MKIVVLVIAMIFMPLLANPQALAQPAAAGKLVFQVNVPNPTADKPQSKLWFAHGSWWAWLPTWPGLPLSPQSAIWRRVGENWQRQTALDKPLAELPCRADVWADEDHVRAVLVDGTAVPLQGKGYRIERIERDKQLAVVGLKYDRDAETYVLDGEIAQFSVGKVDLTVKSTAIETATIARDSANRWWIAYPWQRRMWVRASNAQGWTEPLVVSEAPASDDDLCAIVALPGELGLIWSNQNHEAVYFSSHKDGASVDDWLLEVIEKGNRTADDHIHAAVAADGTLYLATKNSLDEVGRAQLVLRVRHPDGRWENLPYAPRTASEEPSRPIVLLATDPPGLHLLHTLYGRGDENKGKNRIVWQQVPLKPTVESLAAASRSLVDWQPGVNNVTGCKARLPAGQPWIVLASDAEGHIYESRLSPSGVPDASGRK